MHGCVTVFLGDLWGWNGSTWARLSETGPPARGGAPAMAYDRTRGETILTGGGNRAGQFDDLWEWSGTAWTQQR